MDDNLFISDSQSPTRSDAIQNRALLIETAHRLFEAFGVEAVSMSQIAREAGVGKGTLYRHFENKLELCQALLDAAQRDLQERTFEVLRSDLSPYNQLTWFLEQVTIYITSNIDLLLVGSSEFHFAHLHHPAHIWWRDTIYGLLRKIGVEAYLGYMTDVLYVMVSVSTIYFQSENLGYHRDEIIQGIIATVDRLAAK